MWEAGQQNIRIIKSRGNVGINKAVSSRGSEAGLEMRDVMKLETSGLSGSSGD